MGLPAWGLAILVVYPLLQIPAVLLIARYCEVDVGNLPTPPTRAFWTDETPDEDDPVASKGPIAAGDSAGPDEASDSTGPDDAGGVPTLEDAAIETGATSRDDIAMASEVVRCSNCGEHNDPAFGRCRHCVARL